MRNPVKLFIVEGESRDYRFVNEMTRRFFKGRYTATVINLPASQNIYMLYKLLAEDDFETDIVEVLRDNVPNAHEKLKGISRQEIDEVYLFFDYDIHQENLGTDMPDPAEILRSMLEVFENETENGRLYISYPMVEALYDYRQGECSGFSGCFTALEDVGKYKTLSGNGNPNTRQNIEIEDWKEILTVFYLKIKCLFNLEYLDHPTYRKFVTPRSVFSREWAMTDADNRIFTLSAFPQFLFDYFKVDFWNSMIQRKRNTFTICPK